MRAAQTSSPCMACWAWPTCARGTLQFYLNRKESFKLFWLPYLLPIKRSERFIRWWLENRILQTQQRLSFYAAARGA